METTEAPTIPLQTTLALAGLLVFYLSIILFLPHSYLDGILLSLLLIVFISSQYYLSKSLVLEATGAVPIPKAENEHLHNQVERLASQYDMRKPDIARVGGPPNVFTVARFGDNGTICISKSLIDNFSDKEINAVLAHELAHIKNKDSPLMTVFASFPLALSQPLQGLFGGDDQNSKQHNSTTPTRSPMLWLTLPFVVPMAIIGTFFVALFSRSREYAADRAAVHITGEPTILAQAIRQLELGEDQPTTDLRDIGVDSISFISRRRIASLFKLHPPVEKRLKKIKNMERDI